jgi:hypothetical protein
VRGERQIVTDTTQELCFIRQALASAAIHFDCRVQIETEANRWRRP